MDSDSSGREDEGIATTVDVKREDDLEPGEYRLPQHLQHLRSRPPQAHTHIVPSHTIEIPLSHLSFPPPPAHAHMDMESRPGAVPPPPLDLFSPTAHHRLDFSPHMPAFDHSFSHIGHSYPHSHTINHTGDHSHTLPSLSLPIVHPLDSALRGGGADGRADGLASLRGGGAGLYSGLDSLPPLLPGQRPHIPRGSTPTMIGHTEDSADSDSLSQHQLGELSQRDLNMLKIDKKNLYNFPSQVPAMHASQYLDSEEGRK